METQDNNVFIEFSVDGVFRVSEEERDFVMSEIKAVFSKLLDKEGIIKIDTSMNVVSQDDLYFAMGLSSTGVDN